jgi:hypothetical protein
MAGHGYTSSLKMFDGMDPIANIRVQADLPQMNSPVEEIHGLPLETCRRTGSIAWERAPSAGIGMRAKRAIDGLAPNARPSHGAPGSFARQKKAAQDDKR